MTYRTLSDQQYLNLKFIATKKNNYIDLNFYQHSYTLSLLKTSDLDPTLT